MALRRPNRGRRSKPVTLPAPIGGLNGRDGLADMPATDAFVMDNWYPYNTTVDTRNGCQNHVTGAAAAVESLAVYAGGASSKMLGFSNGSVYNVSSAGAIGAAIVSGKTSNKITSTMFSNAGSQFLIGLTAADAPFSYDGVSYTALAITGLTGSQNTLHCVHSFKGRLYFAQKDQLGFYYLAVGAIQGAASYFDLAQQAKAGGYLTGIASFSSQGTEGTGPNDYIVFMTSEGEYLLYAGTDPASAATFQLVGRYYGPPPIGRKGWFNYRSDLYIISAEGIISFTQIREAGQEGVDTKYLSQKLGKAWTALTPNSTTHGWAAVLYPRSGMLVVNAPATSSPAGAYYQFVMNTSTNSWARFVGWDGLCWCVFNGRLYYGTYDGRVVLADEGTIDITTEIKCDCRQAYNYFDDGNGMGDADKHFHFATFVVQADGTPPIAAELCVNFEDDQPDYAGSLTAVVGALWDVATWDVDFWAGDAITQNFTVTFGKIGYTASIWLRTTVRSAPIKWFATRILLERGQGVVLL